MGESQFPVFNSTTAGADGGSSLTPLTTENSDNADGTGNLSSDRNNDHNNADVEEETEVRTNFCLFVVQYVYFDRVLFTIFPTIFYHQVHEFFTVESPHYGI